MAHNNNTNSSLFRRKSRYLKGGAVEDNTHRIGWWERVIFPQDDSDVTYTIDNRSAKRPDLIAYDVYGDPKLMWIVLQYNNIIDINTELLAGRDITIPSKDRVFSSILATDYDRL